MPRNIGTPLSSVNGEEDEVAVAHKVICDTHMKMARKYREIANRRLKNQTVVKGADASRNLPEGESPMGRTLQGGGSDQGRRCVPLTKSVYGPSSATDGRES